MSRRSGWTLSLALLSLAAGTAEAQRGALHPRHREWVRPSPQFRMDVRTFSRQAEVRARMLGAQTRAAALRTRAHARALDQVRIRQQAVRERAIRLSQEARLRIQTRTRPFVTRRYFRPI